MQVEISLFRSWLSDLPARAIVGRSRDARCTPFAFFAEAQTGRRWFVARRSSQLVEYGGEVLPLPSWAISLIIAGDARYELVAPLQLLRLLREAEQPFALRFEQICSPAHLRDFLGGYALTKPLRSGRGAIVTWLRSWLGVTLAEVLPPHHVVLDCQVCALPGWVVLWLSRLAPMATVHDGLVALEGVH